MNFAKMNIDDSRLANTLAELKKVPMAKVIRNAARDFTHAAFKSTPKAKITKSEYYFGFTKGGERYYVHESLASRIIDAHVKDEDWNKSHTKVTRDGRRAAQRRSGLRKVRIAAGWSKASWKGVFDALGMNTEPKKRFRHDTEMASAANGGTESRPFVRIENEIHFDALPNEISRICEAGFRNAAKIMARTVKGELKKRWAK